MDETGKIEIRLFGTNGNLELTPDNYDIKDITDMLENAENLLCPNDRHRPVISYHISQGSVRHVFTTSMQYIIGFNAVIGQISQTGSIDFLEQKTAQAIENLQKVSRKKNYTLEIFTSLNNTNRITLDANTTYLRKENTWVEAEFYFYGKITDAGGKEKANIHLATEEFGTILIPTPIDFLEQYEGNLLYRTMGINATGKQHLHTGAIDMSSLQFVRLVDYRPKYDENYLTGLREKARPWITSINAEEWLNRIRGRV
jgi:hypothetical protein